MRIKFFLLLIILLNIILNLESKSLWKDKNLYTSGGNINVGDIIVVIVNDVSRLRFSVDLSAASSSDISTNEFSGRGSLNISVAAQVTRKLKNGKFRVTGSRTYSFNGIANTIRVSGIVDPAMVKGRAVDSSNIVNFRISIIGTKRDNKLKERKLKKDEKSDANLSEEDKQKILKKNSENMTRELKK